MYYKIYIIFIIVSKEWTNKQTTQWPVEHLERTVHRLAPPYQTTALDFFPLPDFASWLPIPFFQISYAVSRLE